MTQAKPLWIARKRPANTTVPPCGNCGAERLFELQILPQVLNACPSNFDFGTLMIYTCVESCAARPAGSMIEEYALHQATD